MHTILVRHIISTEYLVSAVLVAIFFIVVAGFDWWWLFVLFLVFDISAVGYIFDNRLGALTYNIGHSLIGPIVLIVSYIFTPSTAVLFVALLWLFHIFVDRALGYGLKLPTSFDYTHLGKIGKAKKK